MSIELSQLSADVVEMRDALQILIAGLQQVTASITTQTSMLEEILDAVSAEPPEDSPLTRMLQELIALGERNGQALERIERRLPAQRLDA
jgi:hypothetical protein